ncbi:MAG: 2,3-bisphosphoglycerate-independent phosphoglycerate mutase [Bacteroidia bacterium]|nr:2,3-bisphosphoglycerate-independent phosphoglycerate mutase [Bacteroidia bacterium]NNJ56734.1 2,3-bisphosphoglycerate-independent phosphoglycerate mutase [Bacteroidia bacterium]
MKKVILLILDGWGIGKHDNSDAIFAAKTPFVDSLSSYPNSTLKTYGENVGLPEGQMGNSEVGHMNIGAGRIVWQMLVRINKAFKEKTVKSIPKFGQLLTQTHAKPSRKIHLMGLVSDGGVHSSMDHLIALCEIFKEEGLDDRVYIHAFTDGRDTDPKNGIKYLETVTSSNELGKAKLASICGRYYAMDRDERWERTKKAFDLMVNGIGTKFDNYQDAFESSYANGITDEFIEPCIIGEQAQIEEDDIVVCFNFRTDRGRQITRVLTQETMHEYNMHTLNLNYYTMTEYDKKYNGVNVLFENQDLKETLGEVLSRNGLTQLRAAETEKYPHVTFFFNGGREEPFVGEERTMANSPKVATYDLQPEMSALELTEKLKEKIKQKTFDFMAINYANPDMVGHTGVFEAIVKACETVDSCTKELIAVGRENGYSFIVIADHGNADKAINEDGSPHTAHTTNLVPCYLIDEDVQAISDGILADVAPTILDMMGINQPAEMDGKSLIK